MSTKVTGTKAVLAGESSYADLTIRRASLAHSPLTRQSKTLARLENGSDHENRRVHSRGDETKSQLKPFGPENEGNALESQALVGMKRHYVRHLFEYFRSSRFIDSREKTCNKLEEADSRPLLFKYDK
jgi:hypothetical protein